LRSCSLWLRIWLCLLAALPAAAAAQDGQGTVVIVRVHHDAAVIARIRAELEANDWRVRELGPDANSARAPLASLVIAANARAALRMQPERSAIELWVASEGDAAASGEVVALPSDERDEALLAVRATEALRARGLRLPRRAEAAPVAAGSEAAAAAAAAAPTTGERAAAVGGTPGTAAGEEERKAAEAVAARAAAEARAREQAERERADKERQEKERAEREQQEKERAEQEAAAEAEADEAAATEAESAPSANASAGANSLLYVELGPAMAASSGGAHPSWAAWTNVRLQPSSLWSVSAFAFVPFAGGTFSGACEQCAGDDLDEGTGYIRSLIIGGSADLHGAYRGLELSAGVGGAGLITHIRGTTAAAGSHVNGPNEYTAAALVRAGLQLSLGDRFRLGARGVFGFAIPQLTAQVAPHDVTWGQPFVLIAIALEYALPAPTR
jgi:hypothetical protein